MKKILTLIVAAAALAGCSGGMFPSSGASSPSSAMGASAADVKSAQWCQAFQSHRDRPISELMEACTRQMGDDQCRKCLQ